MPDLPDWLTAYVCDVRDLLGLGEWDITVRLADEVGEAGAGQMVNGEAEVHARYRNARITLRRGLLEEEREDVKHTVFHELLHVALGPASQAVDRICELVPARLQGHAIELWFDGSEQAVELLTRALRKGIKPPKQSTETTEAEEGS